MSRDKQIEEMAKDVTRSICWCNEEIPTVDGMGTAITLYNKGYRKASDVAEEIFGEIGERFKSLLEMLPADGRLTDAKTFIDAHWDFIAHSIMLKYDAELKKKYTEGGE